jgi:hypothetical protein
MNLSEKIKEIITIKEIAFLISYILLWIFPILISLIAALSGNYFSYGGVEWQLINLKSIFLILLLSFVTSLIASIIFLKSSQKKWKPKKKKNNIKIYKYIFLFILAIFSLTGLFFSFGGTIFEKAYSGQNFSWLGIGAYNVVFDIVFFVISIAILKRYGIFAHIFLNTLIFLPILICGSRIDFISVQLAISFFIVFVRKNTLKRNFFDLFFLLIWVFTISQIVGQVRNQFAEAKTTVGATTYSLENLSNPPIAYIPSEKIFYLGTFGNIGLSFFQVYGLLNSNPELTVGFKKAIADYSIRLIPGTILENRPNDFSGTLPEIIGVGATHSLAEGYLIKNLPGVFLVSIFFGILAGFSQLAITKYEKFNSIENCILFSFPLIMLIRSGWYQLFSIFKAASFIVALLLIFYLMDKCIHKLSKKVFYEN